MVHRVTKFYEPRTCCEKFVAFFQNTFEIWQVIVMYLLTFNYQASTVSLSVLMVSMI
jgi:hypothetical protein